MKKLSRRNSSDWGDSSYAEEEILKWEEGERNEEDTPRRGPFHHPDFFFCSYVLNQDSRKQTESKFHVPPTGQIILYSVIQTPVW